MAIVRPGVDEYVKVDGLPLDTPAWRMPDPSSLYDTHGLGADGVDVAYHEGVQPRRNWPGPKRLALPVAVYGTKDSDGNPHPNNRTGLRVNVEELKRHLRARLVGAGTFLLAHELADGNSRTAQAQLASSLQPRQEAPTLLKLDLDLFIPGGVLRSTQQTTASGSSSSGAAFDLTVDNPGTATQLSTVVTLSGTATSVLIESNGLSGVNLDVQVDLNNGDVTIDAGVFTVQQGSSGTDMHGNVSAAGHERWLPLEPGGDTWTVTPSGGDVTVDVEHFAPWS